MKTYSMHTRTYARCKFAGGHLLTLTQADTEEASVFKWSVGTYNETVLHTVSQCDDLLPVSYLACFKCNMNQDPDKPLAHRSVTSQNVV